MVFVYLLDVSDDTSKIVLFPGRHNIHYSFENKILHVCFLSYNLIFCVACELGVSLISRFLFWRYHCLTNIWSDLPQYGYTMQLGLKNMA